MKTSDIVKQEINTGATVVADIATKHNLTTAAVIGSVAALKRQGYVLHVHEGVITVEHNPEVVVVETQVVTAGVEYKRRGRKVNPDSPRQRAFALIREMFKLGVKRKDMKTRLMTELHLKEGHAGIYIQKVRDELGLTQHKNVTA